jgi:hypothetical protein
MNLRDWQKKASEKRDAAALERFKLYQKKLGEIESGVLHIEPIFGAFCYGFDSRDAEIDILLQIIEKQSEALALIKSGLSSKGPRPIAHETQAEVDKLIEQLKGEEK